MFPLIYIVVDSNCRKLGGTEFYHPLPWHVGKAFVECKGKRGEGEGSGGSYFITLFACLHRFKPGVCWASF